MIQGQIHIHNMPIIQYSLTEPSLQKIARSHRNQSKIVKYGKSAPKGQLNIADWNSTAPQSAQTTLQKKYEKAIRKIKLHKSIVYKEVPPWLGTTEKFFNFGGSRLHDIYL